MSSIKKQLLAVSVACLVVGLASPVALAAQEQSEEMKIVLAAEQLLQQQKPQEALEEAQKALEMNAGFAPAHFIMGTAYLDLGRKAEAYDAFLRAAEFNPGWGLAHRYASKAGADLQNFEDSWDQAIKAHQAGTDMSDALAALPNAAPPPADLEARLAAARIFVAPMSVEKFEAASENPFGRTADTGGAAVVDTSVPTTTDDRSNTRATGVGGRVVAETAGDRFQVMQVIRGLLTDSRSFGLVGRQEMAEYVLVIEVDKIADDPARRPLDGYLRLVDARSGEEAYRRLIQLRNIVSRSDVTADLTTIVGILEEWIATQGR